MLAVHAVASDTDQHHTHFPDHPGLLHPATQGGTQTTLGYCTQPLRVVPRPPWVTAPSHPGWYPDHSEDSNIIFLSYLLAARFFLPYPGKSTTQTYNLCLPFTKLVMYYPQYRTLPRVHAAHDQFSDAGHIQLFGIWTSLQFRGCTISHVLWPDSSCPANIPPSMTKSAPAPGKTANIKNLNKSQVLWASSHFRSCVTLVRTFPGSKASKAKNIKKKKEYWPRTSRKEICSISSVLAHRPCPKLEMFCPSVLQLFYGCSKVLMTNHGMSFLFLFNFCFSIRLEIRAQLP